MALSASLGNQPGAGKWIKELSSMANVVVGRCARVLLMKPEELKANFEYEAPAPAKDPSRYARNLLEYCCFRALAVATQVWDHVRDKDFRRWTFDMMLAWEAPAAASQPTAHVDVESSIGIDAFARIAPAIALVADAVTVHTLFELLTEDTGGRMSFSTYNKYLTELDRTVKAMKGQTNSALAFALGIAKGEETIVETDGSPTQPVLQHHGMSAWPGRLSLSDCALYFEPSGVVAYDAARKFDLSADLRHVVRADQTGPWGAKLFDKGIMYKSIATAEPLVLEFPELTGHMRRDYWLAIIREIISVHSFIRNSKIEGSARRQALAKSVRGIARVKTLWNLQKSLPPRPEMLLTFVCTDELPGGDRVLRALAASLKAGDEPPPPAAAATPAAPAGGGTSGTEGTKREGSGRDMDEALEAAGFVRSSPAAVNTTMSPSGSLGGYLPGTPNTSPPSAPPLPGSTASAAAAVASLLPPSAASLVTAVESAMMGGMRGAGGGGGGGKSSAGAGGGGVAASPVKGTGAQAQASGGPPAAGAGGSAEQSADASNGAGGSGGGVPVGDVLVGEMSALERAVLQSRDSSKKMAKARATVDGVKVEGIGTNVALMKELCAPLVLLWALFSSLTEWREPVKTLVFLASMLYIAYRDWLGYALPALLAFQSAFILWLRFARRWSRAPPGRLNEITVITPPSKNAVQQLVVLQGALAQVEVAVQAGNIALLKAHALVLSEQPQATDELVAAMMILALFLAILPIRLVFLICLGEAFTRNLDIRRDSTERMSRRLREWWYNIPVVPVRFLERELDTDDYL